jgi:hypothetical protein
MGIAHLHRNYMSSKLKSLRSFNVFFRLGQLLFDRFTGDIAGNSPVFTKILRDLPFLARAETAERAAQEDQRTAEVIFVERRDVVGQLLP